MQNANVEQLVRVIVGRESTDRLFAMLHHPARLMDWEEGVVTRLELSHAMNMMLFDDLLKRSENGRIYTGEVMLDGGSVFLDHGALRTVRWMQNGALPPGEAAFTRILRPLGFKLNGHYPLDKLGMTGRAYVHEDAPEEVSQFFVSELHPERFSLAFQQAVTNVVSSSSDPLTPMAVGQLSELERDGVLPLAAAHSLLSSILSAFTRRHDIPCEVDYETILLESAEMAWIATEGNAFNHATDRVPDVFSLSDLEKAKGRPMKPDVEHSRSGRVFQTAYRADNVARQFKTADGKVISRTVPGSFYEFITRKRQLDKGSRQWRIDLRFDAGNAQGIFKMTSSMAS